MKMNSFSHSSACLVVESDRKNEAVKVHNFTTEGGGVKRYTSGHFLREILEMVGYLFPYT